MKNYMGVITGARLDVKVLTHIFYTEYGVIFGRRWSSILLRDTN